ncbi:MAG: outer membrane beta-barrel protein [Bacteroidota bacterium]
MRKCLVPALIFAMFITVQLQSQEFKVSAYIDSYIATDNDYSVALDNEMSQRLFSVVNQRTGDFALNIAQISAAMEGDDVRGIFTLQTGDLPMMAFGDAQYSMLQQAFAGYQLADGLWIDAGLFLTHIGGEALLPKDNFLSSHSMVTYFEPFFHAGIRATYDINENVSAQLSILNGSNTQFVDNNKNKTLGWAFGYVADEEVFAISWAGTYGNEPTPAGNNALMFHNLNVGTNAIDNVDLKLQIDFATLEDAVTEDDGGFAAGSYMGISAQARVHINEKLNFSGRFSSFNNEDGILGGEVTGMEATAGIEYLPTENSYIRFEGRYIGLDDDYEWFIDDEDEQTSSRMGAALNFGISLF